MSGLSLIDCGRSELKALERVNYFPRQLLGVDEMVTEREYFLQKLRRHNRFLHGRGVVCGLEVSAASADGAPWRVRIGPGYALGPYGDEIYVAQAVFLDLAHCGPGAATDPCEPNRLVGGTGVTGEVFVAIKYAECLARPVRALPAGCGCEEEDCQYSRICDSFQVECLKEPPPEPEPGPTLCDLVLRKQLLSCPPCPTEPWVVLARVSLPALPTTSLTNAIDNITFRRQIYSTDVLQRQLIECCCKERPQPTPALLKVGAVRILSLPHQLPKETGSVLAPMQDPSTGISVSLEREPNAIEVQFVGSTLNFSTVRDRETFIVNGDRLGPLRGSIYQLDSPNTIRWVRQADVDGMTTLQPDTYTVILVGDPPHAILSSPPDGQPLDGDPIGLPSGDGKVGGNFKFGLTVTAPPPIL